MLMPVDFLSFLFLIFALNLIIIYDFHIWGIKLLVVNNPAKYPTFVAFNNCYIIYI